MVQKRNTCSTICGLVLIILIFFVFGTILFTHNCNKYVKMSCDDKKIYCEFNNYTINSDSCDIFNDDDMIAGNNNCYDLILNCSYTKQNKQNYCDIILSDFVSYESAVEYFNLNFNNTTNIAYLYNTVNFTQCTFEPIYENEKMTHFGLSLILLGIIALFAYLYITRNVYLQLFSITQRTNYESKNYKSIDNDEPPKYSPT